MPFYWFMLALSICLVAYGCVQLAFATSIARSNALQEYYSRPVRSLCLHFQSPGPRWFHVWPPVSVLHHPRAQFPDFNAHLNASIVFCAWITAFVISWKGNLPEVRFACHCTASSVLWILALLSHPGHGPLSRSTAYPFNSLSSLVLEILTIFVLHSCACVAISVCPEWCTARHAI